MSVNHNYNNIKIAVIGCGNWGKNLIRVFHQLGALYAVCDIDPSKAIALGNQYQVPYYTLDKVLGAPEIDGVVIATPSGTHYQLALSCLQANKHIFIEKPFALQTKNALSLKQLAKLQQRIVMVGHLLQYHTAFNVLKQLNSEGVLGELQCLYAYRTNFGKYPSEESVLWDYAPHDISMILSLVGEVPFQVSATQANHLQHTSNDSAHIHLNFRANIQAHIFVSWLHPFKEQKLIVVGNKGMGVFDDCQPWENKLKLYVYPEEWVDGLPRPFTPQYKNIPLTPTEPLFNECQHFLSCISHQVTPITDSTEAAKVTLTLETAMQSMTKQQAITIILPPSLLPELPEKISKQSNIVEKEVEPILEDF